MEDTISNLYTQCIENEVKEDLPMTKLTVKIYSSKDPVNKYNILLNAPVSIMNDCSANSVTFSFKKPRLIKLLHPEKLHSVIS